MIFVSERIVNISELESAINLARFNFDVLVEELKKTAPSKESIDSAVKTINASLAKASDFEFCIEQRKCNFTDVSENPIRMENPVGADSEN